jgi:hypothetical protein
MSTLLLIPLMLGCVLPHPAPPVAAGAEAPVEARETGAAPVSFAPLEERVNVLVAESQDTDRRDRLLAARELMNAMRNKDPVAQHKVYDYLDEVLRIEERSRPAPIGIDGGSVPIEEEPLATPPASTPAAGTPPSPTAPGTPPAATPPVATPPGATAPGATPPGADDTKALAAARVALSETRYLDAIALLDKLASPDAATLKKEAIDGWARVERERAGHLFLEARALAPGGERVASLREARAALAAINTRFPNNAYAAQITDNIAKVDADLAAVGEKP